MAYFQREIQFSRFSVYPEGSSSQFIRIDGVLLHTLPYQYYRDTSWSKTVTPSVGLASHKNTIFYGPTGYTFLSARAETALLLQCLVIYRAVVGAFVQSRKANYVRLSVRYQRGLLLELILETFFNENLVGKI